jgi:hypothetical protein
MSDLVAECMQQISFVKRPGYEEYVTCDKETRSLAWRLLEKKKAVTYTA